MKIACVISSLRLGGAERQLVGLAETLADLGHTPEIITYHDENFYEDAVTRKGLRHTVIKGIGAFGIIAKLASTDADVMVSYLVGTNIKACLAKQLNPKLKLIVSERNCNTGYHFHDRLRFILYNRYADVVLCNNYSQEQFIKEKFPKLSGKLTTIPNFVDIKTFYPSDEEKPARNHFVVTARVCSRKNTIGLIRAAKELRNDGASKFRIDWYGVQEENRYVKRCRRLIERSHLERRFKLHPATSDVAQLYRDADFFCLPSFYEGTSNSLAEALASGLPIACSAVSDNMRYVIGGINGWLFPPFRTKPMADALSRLMFLTPEERRKFSEASRAAAASGLSRETFAEGWKKLLTAFEK